jgi:hypothetical protein
MRTMRFAVGDDACRGTNTMRFDTAGDHCRVANTIRDGRREREAHRVRVRGG